MEGPTLTVARPEIPVSKVFNRDRALKLSRPALIVFIAGEILSLAQDQILISQCLDLHRGCPGGHSKDINVIQIFIILELGNVMG